MFWKNLFGLRNREIPELDEPTWKGICRDWPLFSRLPPAESADLRELSDGFLATKYLEGVRGLVLTPRMERVIALLACLPILKLGLDCYRDWNNIFVAPRAYTDTRKHYGQDGVVTETEDELSGEVLELGPVVLSWQDVCEAGQCRGYNVVVHEMAHKLDGLDGEMDGMPPLTAAQRVNWRAAFIAAYEDFCARAVRASRGQAATERARFARLPLDDYAAESPEEFFAVVCEVFFERPLRLKHEWPGLYACLCDFFRLDPAEWI